MRRIALVGVFGLMASMAGAAEPGPTWIAVVAPAFREAITPLAEWRRSQGWKVSVVTTTEVLSEDDIRKGRATALRNHIAHLAQSTPETTTLLLVGSPAAEEDIPPACVVPTLFGTEGRMRGQPSDNGYALPDEALCPRLAVGRFPARTPLEARGMVAKTLRFEQDNAPGAWKRRLTVLAGAPEFHPAVDSVIERMAMAQLAKIDPSWTGQALYHNLQSRYYLPDELVRARAKRYIQEGQTLTLYLGHSAAAGIYANREIFLDRQDWEHLEIPHGGGVFASFGCYACQQAPRGKEGYGLAAIRNPQGPAAVLGSHGECFAAMVKLASEPFLEAFLGSEPPQRLAGPWRKMKEGLARGKIDFVTYSLLTNADGDPRIPQAVQRREHQEMFLLFGDPALQLPSLLRDVVVRTSGEVAPGKDLLVHGNAPRRLEGATVRVTLERSRVSEPLELVEIPPQQGPERIRALVERHERSNSFVLGQSTTTLKEGQYSLMVRLPEKLPTGPILVRVYATTKTAEGLGVKVLGPS